MSAQFAPAIKGTALISMLAFASIAQAGQDSSHPTGSSTGSAAQMPAAGGLEAPWDVTRILASVLKDNQELKLLIAGMNPQQWYDQKGASSTYIVQWTTAQRQVNDVVFAARLLSQSTESLSQALDTYFRLEALDTSARSLNEGARKYGDHTQADKLNELIARNFSNRERFRDYLRDLATSKEQNFKIADAEAQRCRGMISKQPVGVSRTSKRN